MATNRGVIYMGPGKVEIQSIDFRKLVLTRGEDKKETFYLDDPSVRSPLLQ